MNTHGETARSIGIAYEAAVVPVNRDKQPGVKSWQKLSREASLLPNHLSRFGPAYPNVGIVLGSASGGLCTIDCDSAEALNEFLARNPRLRSSLLTKAHRGGNVWVRIIGDRPKLARLSRNSKPWGEWRSDGGYTVIHGIHKMGMPYTSNGLPPIEMPFKEIQWPEGVMMGTKQPHSPLHSSEKLNPELLNPCIPESLHPLHNSADDTTSNSRPEDLAPVETEVPVPCSADQVLAALESRRRAEKALAARYPALVQLYSKFIEQRFQAIAGARNAFLVEAIPFLYRAVAPALILPLVMHYYDCNRALFRDSREQHRKEAQAMIDAVAASFIAALPAPERNLYESLESVHKAAFRILRDLALLPDPAGQVGTFFISCNQLADRLGLHPPQAQRILHSFAGLGLIKQLTKGTRRTLDTPPEASTYRWLLVPSCPGG